MCNAPALHYCKEKKRPTAQKVVYLDSQSNVAPSDQGISLMRALQLFQVLLTTVNTVSLILLYRWFNHTFTSPPISLVDVGAKGVILHFHLQFSYSCFGMREGRAECNTSIFCFNSLILL